MAPIPTVKRFAKDGRFVLINAGDQAMLDLWAKKGYSFEDPPSDEVEDGGGEKSKKQQDGGGEKPSKPKGPKDPKDMTVPAIKQELEQLGIGLPAMADREQLEEMLRIARSK